jgi:predicted nucleic acid-binding protein
MGRQGRGPVTILDTDILIDAARGVAEAIHCLDRTEQESGMAVSVITAMELAVGCRNKAELRQTENFLKKFQILPLSEAVSYRAHSLLHTYRLSHGLLIPDSLIAATALELNLPLATKNQRDYAFIEGLQLLTYP